MSLRGIRGSDGSPSDGPNGMEKMFLWLVYREDYFGFACLMLGKFGKIMNKVKTFSPKMVVFLVIYQIWLK